jgi:hypothetical protein
MQPARLILAAALLIGAAPPGPKAPAWLAGAWETEQAGSWTEERWTPPRGGVMLGTSLSGKGQSATWFEYMRIAPDEADMLHFYGSPQGKPAVAFRVESAAADSIVFVNPAHDFPTRISYRRAGDRLVATVSGPGGANPQTWNYRRAE